MKIEELWSEIEDIEDSLDGSVLTSRDKAILRLRLNYLRKEVRDIGPLDGGETI